MGSISGALPIPHPDACVLLTVNSQTLSKTLPLVLFTVPVQMADRRLYARAAKIPARWDWPASSRPLFKRFKAHKSATSHLLRKRELMTEGKFHLSEAMSRLVVEHSDDILTIRDADGRIRYTSPSFHRVMGYKQEEVIGETGFDLLHPEDRANVLTAMDEFMKSPGARDSIQYRARHANGSWVSLEVVAYNLLDHPVIQGVLISGRDISNRKRDEAVKDQLIWELQQTLAVLNTLTGVLPICASCKKIQNEDGSWQQIELYIRERAQVEFSHGMCPECTRLWFPEPPEQ